MSHASDDLRQAFEEIAEGSRAFNRDAIEGIIRALWDCTDIMPADLCLTLDLKPGSTFGQGAQKMGEDFVRAALPQVSERLARRGVFTTWDSEGLHVVEPRGRG